MDNRKIFNRQNLAAPLYDGWSASSVHGKFCVTIVNLIFWKVDDDYELIVVGNEVVENKVRAFTHDNPEKDLGERMLQEQVQKISKTSKSWCPMQVG